MPRDSHRQDVSGAFYHSHQQSEYSSTFGVPHSISHSSGESDSGSFSGSQHPSAPNDPDFDSPFLPHRRPTTAPAIPEFDPGQVYPSPHRPNQAAAPQVSYTSYPPQQQQQHDYGPERHGYPVYGGHPGLQRPPPPPPPPQGGSQGYYRHHTQSYSLVDPSPHETHSDSSASSQSQQHSPISFGRRPEIPCTWIDPGPALRKQMNINESVPVDLWALPDPPPGQKPSHSLPMLIKLAIYGSPRKMLTLQEIYTALGDRFQWYRENSDKKPWKNSIRHNLSLNKVFRAVQRPITEPGKGHYWRVDLSEGEGHKRPRKRRTKNRSVRPSSDEDDDENIQPQIDAGSSSGTGGADVEPATIRRGHHVGGRRERSTFGRSSPYPATAIRHRPSRTDSGPSSPHSTSSSSHTGSAYALVPPDTPIQGPPRFDQPTFGQSSFGRPSFPQASFGHVSSATASSTTSSTITSNTLPRAFIASQAERVSLGPTRDSSAHGHVARLATHDRHAPVVLPPPRPGVVIVDGPLPSARRVPDQQYYSPFSEPGSHDPQTEHS